MANKAIPKPTNQGAREIVVDCYGEAKKQLAVAKQSADVFRDEIASWGDGDYNGDFFRSTVRTTTAVGIPIEAALAQLAKYMTPANFRRWMRRNQRATVKTTVTCVARVEGK